ncbi:MAG: PIG-L family deacetylase [Acidimicrobiales bacterium]
MSPATLVVFHAHPDDEALLDAGTLARAVQAGHRVVLVFATKGGAGDVGAGVLSASEALAERRAAEAQASGAALGVARVAFLDYLDSGHAPDPDGTWPVNTFCAATVDSAALALAKILIEEHAGLLITDDRNGGYGHPDHVQVHKVAWAAAHQTNILLAQATIDREFLSGGIELAKSMGLEIPPGFVPVDLSSWYTPHAEITHTVDVSSVLRERRASMAAHATQATGAVDTVRTLAVFLDLPDEIFALAFSIEWFIFSNTSGPIVAGMFPDLFLPVDK